MHEKHYADPQTLTLIHWHFFFFTLEWANPPNDNGNSSRQDLSGTERARAESIISWSFYIRALDNVDLAAMLPGKNTHTLKSTFTQWLKPQASGGAIRQPWQPLPLFLIEWLNVKDLSIDLAAILKMNLFSNVGYDWAESHESLLIPNRQFTKAKRLTSERKRSSHCSFLIRTETVIMSPP